MPRGNADLAPVGRPKTGGSRREVQISTPEIQLAAFGEVKYG